jgi:hypothetical protein
MTTTKGGEPFDWSALVPRVVHPLRVAIVEALLWLDQPLSSTDLVKLLDDPEIYLSHVAYHVSRLVEASALKPIHRRQVRGATETFYFFA